jgi:hypothetical protein
LIGAVVKKTAILLSCALLISIGVSFHSVKADSNNPIVFSGGITLYSPTNETYDSNYLTLSLNASLSAGVHTSINYSIDGAVSQGPIPLVISKARFPFYIGTVSVELPKLSAGSHSLTIYEQSVIPDYNGASPPGAPFKPTAPGSADYVASWVDTVFFTIDSNMSILDSTPPEDATPPKITLLSIENKTYNQDNLPLDFTVDKPTSWIGYCLDGQVNVTTAENFTLTELPSGSHTLTIYANDTVGNMGTSSTIDFNIAEPFPTTLAIITFGAFVALVGVGLLAYFKKRNHAKINKQVK